MLICLSSPTSLLYGIFTLSKYSQNFSKYENIYFGACCLMANNCRSNISFFFLSNITSLCTSNTLFAWTKLFISCWQRLKHHCTRDKVVKRSVGLQKKTYFCSLLLPLFFVSCLICSSYFDRVCFPRAVSVMPANMSLATRPKEKVCTCWYLTCIKQDLFD